MTEYQHDELIRVLKDNQAATEKYLYKIHTELWELHKTQIEILKILSENQKSPVYNDKDKEITDDSNKTDNSKTGRRKRAVNSASGT